MRYSRSILTAAFFLQTGCAANINSAPFYKEGFVESYSAPLVSKSFTVMPPEVSYAYDEKIYYAIGEKKLSSNEGFTFMWMSNCYGGEPKISWIYGLLQNDTVNIENFKETVQLSDFSCGYPADSGDVGKAFEIQGGKDFAYLCKLNEGQDIKVGYLLSSKDNEIACSAEAKNALIEALDSLKLL